MLKNELSIERCVLNILFFTSTQPSPLGEGAGFRFG